MCVSLSLYGICALRSQMASQERASILYIQELKVIFKLSTFRDKYIVSLQRNNITILIQGASKRILVSKGTEEHKHPQLRS